MWRTHKNSHYQHCIISRENNHHQLKISRSPSQCLPLQIKDNNAEDYLNISSPDHYEGPLSQSYIKNAALRQQIHKNSAPPTIRTR